MYRVHGPSVLTTLSIAQNWQDLLHRWRCKTTSTQNSPIRPHPVFLRKIPEWPHASFFENHRETLVFELPRLPRIQCRLSFDTIVDKARELISVWLSRRLHQKLQSHKDPRLYEFEVQAEVDCRFAC